MQNGTRNNTNKQNKLRRLKLNNITYPIQNNRTIEVTVGLLVDAVNKHYDVDRVLADFGIRVLGRVNYAADIPGNSGDIEDRYQGNFGDAYLVSQNHDGQAPFDIFIWTRLTPDSVEPEGYWLNLGLLSTVGPRGPEGPEGPKGATGESTRWYVFSTLPTSGTYKPGDVALLPNGDVYMYVNEEYGWSNATQVNIRGPQGSRGIDGATPTIVNGVWWINGQSTGIRAEGLDGANGTPGTAILIQGKLSSIDLLPDASTAPRNYGYLINVGGVQRLYFIAGIEGEQNWQYIQYSGNGTIVTTNGTALDTWDTSTKVNKSNIATRVYATNTNAEDSTIEYSSGVKQYTMMYRYTDGRCRVGVPVVDDDCATKKYVDDGLDVKVSKITGSKQVYCTNSAGETSKVLYAIGPEAYSIAQRGASGALEVATPTKDTDAANKKYVDDALASAGGGDYITKIITIQSEMGQYATLNISDLTDIVPNTIVDVVATISFTGIESAPGYISQLGGSYAASGTYDGLPYFSNDMNHWMGRLNQNGSMFFASVNQAIPGVSGISGNSFTIGTAQSGVGGQTTLTVRYTAYA